MNIGFFIFGMNKGGAERVTANLANYFDDRGDNVSLFLVSDDEPMYELNICIDVRHLWQKHKESPSLVAKISYNIRLIKALRKHLRDTKCDVLLCMSAGSVYRTMLAGIGVAKVIGTEQTNPYKAYSKSRLFFNKLAYRMTDGYIFQTTGAKKCYGNKGVVIGNPVMTETRNIAWNDRKKNAFCAVGRLAGVKNYPHMIRMFEALHSSDGSVTLDIYGIGDEEPTLRKLIDEIEAGEYIQLKGKVEKVCDCLVNYPFFLMCSKYEGMPNALIEGMLCGCVCFVTDFDFGPSELIQDGRNGFLMPENDTNALSDWMQKAVEDGTAFDEISGNAVSTIKVAYNMSYIGEKYRNYISEIIT